METYFVTSDGEEPKAIYFNMDDAIASGEEFIDVFNELGKRIKSYWRESEREYTMDF